MNDETMKNEKNSGVSDAAVSGPLWTHLKSSKANWSA